MPKRKYLTNENILREIHKSKNSFCYFIDKIYEDYDVILESKEMINQELKKKILEEKLEKVQQYEQQRKRKSNNSQLSQNKIDERKRDLVVFRVYTDEHIPSAFLGYNDIRTRYSYTNKSNEYFFEIIKDEKTSFIKQSEITDSDFDDNDENNFYDRNNRLIFRPFKHYILDDNNNLIEVGRSHWKGDFETGKFSQSHGKLTDELGKMILLLVERYSQRGNWRSYTYLEEMKGTAIVQLCQIALKFDESKSSNPFAYYTSSVNNSFTKILNIEKKNQYIKDDILIDGGFDPSFGRQLEEEKKDKENQSL